MCVICWLLVNPFGYFGVEQLELLELTCQRFLREN